MPGPAWLNALPEIREEKSLTDEAVRTLATRMATLTAQLGQTNATPDELVREYGAVYGSWTDLLNRTERLAGLGLALAEDHPVQAKYLVCGTVIELLENVLDSAAILSRSAGQLSQEDPLQFLRQQARALEAAQELVAHSFPDSATHYRERFESFDLPVPGFTNAAAIPATAPGAATTVQRGEVLRILHISDLHRTPDERVSNPEVLADLARSLTDLGDLPIEMVVLSGDITQAATVEEFQEAEAFLNQLVARFLNNRRECLIVAPGNHDISWAECAQGSFSVQRNAPPDDGVQRHGIVTIPGGHIVPSEQTLRAAQANFRDSFRRLFGRDYPVTPAERFQYIEPDGLPIGILVLDTTVGMHHMNDAAYLDRAALIDGLERARAGARPRFIVVGHHGPIRDRNQHDGIDAWCLDRILDGGAVAYLHGHVHETQVSYYSRDGILGLSCIGVGSLVAGPEQRPEAAPRQYHIVDIPLQERTGRVYVRRKDGRDRRWSRDTRHGNPASPVDYLEFRM